MKLHQLCLSGAALLLSACIERPVAPSAPAVPAATLPVPAALPEAPPVDALETSLALPPLEPPQPLDHGDPANFPLWLETVKADAIRRGVRLETAAAALDGLALGRQTVALDRVQPETRASFRGYLDRRLTEAKIGRGRASMRDYAPLLQRIARAESVPANMVAAIWGMETDYGGFQGGFEVVRSLASLAYDGRRAALFYRELMAALLLLDRGIVGRDDFRGSWAGAYGQTQFMPSNILRYGVDGDGDGRIDLRGSVADALASTARYLHRAGWDMTTPWGLRVMPPAGFDRATVARAAPAVDCPRVYAAHSQARPVSWWRAAGFTLLGGRDWPSTDLDAVLVEPDGAGGLAYLTFANYRVLLDYNCSNFYALSVALLADAIDAPTP